MTRHLKHQQTLFDNLIQKVEIQKMKNCFTVLEYKMVNKGIS
jgi:hypothetical protein